MSLETFIAKARTKFGDKYDYSRINYSWKAKVEIVCPIHGSFWQVTSSHLAGKGCPLCARDIIIEKNTKPLDHYLAKAKASHGDKYDYSLINYAEPNSKVSIVCSTHGVFHQSMRMHTMYGCPKCGMEQSINSKRMNTLSFINKSKEIHGDKYDYSETEFLDSRTKLSITCLKHGAFSQTSDVHLVGCGCPKCGNSLTSSKAEKEVVSFIETLMGKSSVLASYRLPNKQELDIYLPEFKLAIEYNGLYFHSSSGNKNPKPANYHKDKLNYCRTLDISLLQIFEDEWVNPVRQEIWKSIIRHKLGLTESKIYARKCQLIELDFKIMSTFLEENHLMGKDSSPIRYGLTHDGTLVSVITFSKPNISSGKAKHDFVIGRFAVLRDTTVVGGFSKLLKHFLKTFPNVTLSTAADLRYSVGDVYTKNGFTHTHDTQPNYWYWRNNTKKPKRYHRFGFRKQLLSSKLETFDPSLTEKQNMVNNGWKCIYDAGSAMFEYKR